MREVSESGLLTTAGDVLFSGSIEGNLMALDVETGKLLWRKKPRRSSGQLTYYLPCRWRAILVREGGPHTSYFWSERVVRHPS